MNIKHAVSFLVGMITGRAVMHVLHKRTKEPTLEGNNAQPTTGIEIAKINSSTGMRKFSEREQQTIRRLIEGTANSYSYVLFNVYNDVTYRRNVEFQYGKDKSQLVFYRKSLDQVTPDELLEIENEIMEISLLISYLQANGLIYLIENTSVNVLNEAGGFLKDGLVGVGMDLDSNIAKILHDSLNHRVFVGYTLRELASNGFKSIEERTLAEAQSMVGEAKRQADAADVQAGEAKQQTVIAHKQTRLSIWAVILSIVSIIIGVISSVLVAKYITMDVRVDSRQIDSITSRMKEIEERIDSVNFQLQRNTDKGDKSKVIEPVNNKNKK